MILDPLGRHRSTVAERLRRTILRFGAVVATALALAPGAHAGGPGLVIGATEDAPRSALLSVTKADMNLIALAGFRAVRITQIWSPGDRTVSATDRTILRNVMSSAALDAIQVLVSVLPYGSATTPLTATDQADFAAYAATVAGAAPGVRIVIVGNEPNLNRYWLPQFNDDGSDAAAPAYESLLALTYDALKAESPSVTVLGGAVSPRGGDAPGIRPTHSPTVFIRDLGTAYRASGRTKPIMDGFAFHPYEDNSSIAPVAGAHPNTTTIALADYDKLVAALGEAFDGTAQTGSALPIYYDEFGVETAVPAAKASYYAGSEPIATRPVSEAVQAAYYRQAIELAFCQPTVKALFLFHAFDEPALAGWQSGLYYVDLTPKASLAPVRAAMELSRRGVVAHCPGMRLSVQAKASQQNSHLLLTCDLDCSYVAQLYRLPGKLPGKLLVSKRGRAIGQRASRLPLTVPRAAGRYRLRLSATATVNPGAATTLLQAVRPG